MAKQDQYSGDQRVGRHIAHYLIVVYIVSQGSSSFSRFHKHDTYVALNLPYQILVTGLLCSIFSVFHLVGIKSL